MSGDGDGLDAVKQSLEGARIMTFPTSGGPPAEPEVAGRDPVEYDDETGLPKDCPVQPLGIDRNVIFVLTSRRQVMALSGRDRSRNTIPALFGQHMDKARKWWPRLKKTVRMVDGDPHEQWEITGIKSEDLFDDLVAACDRAGIWDPTNAERSTGGWALPSGDLVFHVGDGLITATEKLPLGVTGKHVYSGAKAIQRPWPAPVDVSPGLELLDVFESWNWKRGHAGDPLDATLLLGWHAASRLGAALPWRPMCFVIGGKGTGKSTLHETLKKLHADDGVIYTTDTSQAALANLIGHSSRPVIVDELENSGRDQARARGVVELARLAASGAPRHRSDPNQGVSVTVARNAMLFGAINPPEMSSADRSRFAMLRLEPLAADAAPLTDDPVYWDELGRKIMRRLLDHWPSFRVRLEAFHAGLTGTGHSKRSADQYATMLAAAHMLLSGAPPDAAEVARWAARLHPDQLTDLTDAGDDALNCIDHLAKSMPAERFGGGRQSTAELVAQVMTADTADAAEAAQQKLGVCGMRMYRAMNGARVETHADGKPKWLLGVALSHPGLSYIFERTDWQTGPGVTPGAWVESLRRLDGAFNDSKKIAGRQTRQVVIPARQHLVDPWERGTDDED